MSVWRPTDGGNFSSHGGWNSADPNRLRINVQAPPVQLSSISITDPIDVKWMPPGQLYILSRSIATLSEYDVTGSTPAPLRSVNSIGNTPTGIDVDSAGNVYVAISGDNQVARYKPHPTTPSLFQLDTSFGTGGRIGAAGSGNAQFNGPYDVALSPNGSEIGVSDSGNNRVQRFRTDGSFIGAFGQAGGGSGQFSSPKGIAYDSIGYLYIIDSGNSRVALWFPPSAVGTSGAAGTSLGQFQFQTAANLGVGTHGIYVADSGNNRVQAFDPLPHGQGVSRTPLVTRLALASLGLSNPSSVAPAADLLQEKVYIADTGNNRVLLASLPGDDPTATWGGMIGHLSSGDIDGAIAYFSATTADSYRESFLGSGSTEAASDAAQIPAIVPVFIEAQAAQYSFDMIIGGITVTFPISFVKENGTWKVLDY